MSIVQEIAIPAWLKRLIAELKKLRDKERKDDLHARWLMGKRLNEERELVKYGEKMEYLEQVSLELGEGYSVGELQARIKFCQKHPDWNTFLTRQRSQQSSMPSWREITHQMLYDTIQKQADATTEELKKNGLTPEQFFRPTQKTGETEEGERKEDTEIQPQEEGAYICVPKSVADVVRNTIQILRESVEKHPEQAEEILEYFKEGVKFAAIASKPIVKQETPEVEFEPRPQTVLTFMKSLHQWAKSTLVIEEIPLSVLTKILRDMNKEMLEESRRALRTILPNTRKLQQALEAVAK